MGLPPDGPGDFRDHRAPWVPSRPAAMPHTMKITSIVGARPQFVKAAMVSRKLRERGAVERLVHTGQHYDADMSQVFFEQLELPRPDANLGIGSGTHGQQTGRMLEALEADLLSERPDFVLVYGDTNSTVAGALAAAKLQIPLAHVEAGLRSFNRRMPEEINRVLTDHTSTLLFCPTHTAVRNLEAEGIRWGVHHVGDVMYDAVVWLQQRGALDPHLPNRMEVGNGDYAVATLHRAENTDDRNQLVKLLAYLDTQAEQMPLLLVLHPRTRKLMARHGLSVDRARIVAPLGYLEMHSLLAGAARLYTDSGGMQKEACFHHVPCVTLREETEWVETVEAGWNRLWQTEEYRPRREIEEYGHGDAAQRIVSILLGVGSG